MQPLTLWQKLDFHHKDKENSNLVIELGFLNNLENLKDE